MPKVNLDDVRDVLPVILEDAGSLALKHKRKGFTEKDKSKLDFVTSADLAVDEFLRTEIEKRFPESEILTEETAPKDFTNLKFSESLWIIDPIDGTTNFSRNSNNWCISVAYVEYGNTTAGFVYQPEDKVLYHAYQDDESAFRNNEAIKVSKVDDLTNASVAIGWSWDLDKREKEYKTLDKFYKKVRAITCSGSAAIDMCILAQGNLDVYILYGMYPWDVAASSLILSKAGGKLTDPEGASWNIFNPDCVGSNSTLIHKEFFELVNS